MRLDIDEFDQYDEAMRLLCRRAEIYLNGQKMEKVIVADEEEGYIIRHKTDLLGHPVIEDGDIVQEKLTGEVRIVDPDQPTAGQKA